MVGCCRIIIGLLGCNERMISHISRLEGGGEGGGVQL